MGIDWLSSEEEIKNRAFRHIEPEKYEEVCAYCGKRHYKFERAPASILIEVWQWTTRCYACKGKTRVVYPVKDKSGFLFESPELNNLHNFAPLISQKYPFVKKTNKKLQDTYEYGNTCENCGAYQGDWYIFEEYIDICYDPEYCDEIVEIEVPLTEEERIIFVRAREFSKMHRPRSKKYPLLCEDCYKLYKKKVI